MPEDRTQTRYDSSAAVAGPVYAGQRNAEWSWAWDSRSVVALLVVVLISTTVMIIYHNRFWAPADEGMYAHVADRVAGGQVLHRDVQDLYAGYVNLINAAAFSVFGIRMVSMRYPLAVLTVIQAGVMFLILRHRGVTTAVVGALVLTALGFVQFLNPTANWYTLFLAVMTIAWLSSSPLELTAREVVTGVLLGTTFLFRQLSGVFLACGVLVFLLLEQRGSTVWNGRGLARATLALIAFVLTSYILRATDPFGWALFGVWPLAALLLVWRRTNRSNREVVATLRNLGLGSVLSLLPLLAYLLIHGALDDWFRDTFVAALSLPSLGFMTRPGYLMLGLLAWRGFHSGDLDKLLNAGLYTCLLLTSALLGVLLFRAFARGSRASRHPLPVIATFYSLVSLHYQVPLYLFYTVGLSLAAVLYLTSESKASTRRLALAVSMTIAVIALYYQAAMPLSRHFAGIVAGERRFPATALPSPAAGIYVDAAEAQLYSSLLQLIDRETQPGDTIFALPYSAELYFLGRRTNPFRFYNTAVGVRSAADLDSVLQVLRCHPPKLVFYDPTDKYNTPASVRIAATVRTEYEKLAPVPPFEVFRATHPPDCGTTSRPERSRP